MNSGAKTFAARASLIPCSRSSLTSRSCSSGERARHGLRRRGCWIRSSRRACGTHRLCSIIQCRSVSTDSRKPCSSVGFSWVSAGPKPSYWDRTEVEARWVADSLAHFDTVWDAMVAAQSQVQDEVTEQEGTRRRTRVFTGHLFRVRDGKSWAFTDKAPEPSPEPVYRPARVTQMLALAHRLEAAIERGDYTDRADVARPLGFTRARITQLLDRTLLAPDLQERVLDLEAIDGREPLAERGFREVMRHGAGPNSARPGYSCS